MDPSLARMVAFAEQGRNKEVEDWARPRAVQGDADAQFMLGYLACTGGGIAYLESWEWFRKAAAQDHAEAIYELSHIDETQTRWHWMRPISDTMRARLRRAAELGSDRAQYHLGLYLHHGDAGFKRDDAEARLWYERAAADGNREAEASLAHMYFAGEGGPALVPQGLALLEKVAATDLNAGGMGPLQVSSAAGFLCNLYARGAYGIPPDEKKAQTYRKRREEAQALLAASREADEYAIAVDANGQSARRPMAFANPAEAKSVLAKFMAQHRARGYEVLAKSLHQPQAFRERGPSGLEYRIDVHVSWEDQPDGPLSVSASIEDYGWRTYRTISESCVIAPDGTISD